MNCSSVYMCHPHPEPPSHLPPTLSLCPRRKARTSSLAALLHSSNLQFSSILLIVTYMFQCYSLKSSHPQLLPLSANVCVYICACFAVPHEELLVPFVRIPYTCVNIQYLSFSFCLTSLCIIGSSFIQLIRTDSNEFLFIVE